jgi:hypothetical protein
MRSWIAFQSLAMGSDICASHAGQLTAPGQTAEGPRRPWLRTERTAIVEGLLLVLRAQGRFDALDQPLPLGRPHPREEGEDADEG